MKTFKSDDWKEVRMRIPTESSRVVRGAGKCIPNTFHELYAKMGTIKAESIQMESTQVESIQMESTQVESGVGNNREPAPVIALVNGMHAAD